jgi:hypothetical protein
MSAGAAARVCGAGESGLACMLVLSRRRARRARPLGKGPPSAAEEEARGPAPAWADVVQVADSDGGYATAPTVVPV